MVYGEDDMSCVEIDMPSYRHYQFDQEVNKEGLECKEDLIDELREVTHVREFYAKHRAVRSYNSKVRPREMWERDLVLK